MICLVLLLSLLLNAAASSDFPFHSPHIVELTESTYREKTQKGIWFIEFYSPRCSHCQRLAPTFAKIAEAHIGLRESHQFFIANLDCHQYRSICDEEKIFGYPTMNLYKDGKFIQEQYLQDFESINKFVLDNAKKLAPPDKIDAPVSLTPELFHKETNSGLWMVEFFVSWCGHCQRFAPTYKSVAEKYNVPGSRILLASVDCVTYRDFCNSNDISGFPTVKIYSQGTQLETYDGARDFQSVDEYITTLLAKDLSQTSKNEQQNEPNRLKLQQNSKYKMV